MPDCVTFDACAPRALDTDYIAVFKKVLLARLAIWHAAMLKLSATQAGLER